MPKVSVTNEGTTPVQFSGRMSCENPNQATTKTSPRRRMTGAYAGSRAICIMEVLLCERANLKAGENLFWLSLSAVLTVKGGRAILSADHQNIFVTTRVFRNPGV